jgi:hypothetical protein
VQGWEGGLGGPGICIKTRHTHACSIFMVLRVQHTAAVFGNMSYNELVEMLFLVSLGLMVWGSRTVDVGLGWGAERSSLWQQVVQ